MSTDLQDHVDKLLVRAHTIYMFHIEKSLGFLVSQLASSMRSDLERHLAPFGLTAPQWAVLMRLRERDAWQQKELGQTLGMDKATVGGVLARLAARRLVVRDRDTQDARVVRVTATAEGRALVRSVQSFGNMVNMHATSGFSENEIADLKRLLIRARTCLEDA